MATAYKTPGVFVEEIPKLPPSVAPVETAIPAFIGYTEKAEKNGESLFGKARSVESLAEFETWYGKGPATTYNAYLDASDRVAEVESTLPYCLYDALKLYFDNGGGRCYIISVSAYKTSGTLVDATLLNGGLAALEKEDDSRLTDAVGADEAAINQLQITIDQKCAQIIAKRGADRDLLSAAQWVFERLT